MRHSAQAILVLGLPCDPILNLLPLPLPLPHPPCSWEPHWLPLGPVATSDIKKVSIRLEDFDKFSSSTYLALSAHGRGLVVMSRGSGCSSTLACAVMAGPRVVLLFPLDDFLGKVSFPATLFTAEGPGEFQWTLSVRASKNNLGVVR